MRRINLNEIYLTTQGEGPSLGRPSIFLRLAGCNLTCVWCDSHYTWYYEGKRFRDEARFPFQKVKRAEEVEEYELDAFREKVRAFAQESGINNVVITGGEPMIQWKAILASLGPLKAEGFRFEMETNGTIPVEPDFARFVDQINCSPKLANSGNDLGDRLKVKALQSISRHPNAYLKFVYTGSEQDTADIEAVVALAMFPSSRVYIMPEGTTRASQQGQAFDRAAEFAIRHGFNISPRVHILIHEDKRAV